MYVDDTSLMLASTDIEHINYCLNHDLSNVYKWLSANKLTLNMTKTEFMLIASGQKLSQFSESPSLTINENAIEQVTSAKSLGVYVDQNINWECHIENISKLRGYLVPLVHLTPFHVLIKVYNSLIQPHFDYCNLVWGNCKGRFPRYDFVACDKFTTGLRHELFRVNQTYNSLTTVVYVKKIVVGF